MRGRKKTPSNVLLPEGIEIPPKRQQKKKKEKEKKMFVERVSIRVNLDS